MKKVLIVLAPGFEEIEALAPADILRRAGADVVLAGTTSGPVEGRNRVKVQADAAMGDVAGKDFDLIVLPGGALGTENLKKDQRVREMVLRHYRNGRMVSAICAAPVVLASLGITRGKRITAHPSVHAELKGEDLVNERVVRDGNLITSQGPGTAIEFSLRLVELLFDEAKAKEVARAIVHAAWRAD